jgi:dTDP-4-amino-4,6-dideoxygalactose transaminase
VLKSGKVNYWTGHQVKDFEREFAEYVGTKHAIALANGTLALELALKAIDLQPEDQVIVTPRSFIASASSVVIAGNATPIFSDIDPQSQNLTAETIKPHLTPQTKAVICVHLAGWPCPMEEIIELCHSRGIYVIEDCAQAHGARINGCSVGSFGDFGCWSFCQDKIITTGGEGGMITLNDDALYRKAWSYKDHGKDFDLIFNPDPDRPPGYVPLYTSLGTNWRMTEMQAAIGREMLKRLESMVEIRRQHANYFDCQLSQLQQQLSRPDLIQLSHPPSKVKHSFYRYYFKLTDPELRRQLLQLASQQAIPCYAGSASQLYLEQGFADYCPAEPLPNAQLLEEQSVCLLTDHTITQDYLNGVIDLITQVLTD